MAFVFFLFAILGGLVPLPLFFFGGIGGGSNRRYAALKFLIFTHVGFVIMLFGIFTLYFNSAGVNAAGYGTNANTLDMTAFLHGALRHETGGVAIYVPLVLRFLDVAIFLCCFSL